MRLFIKKSDYHIDIVNSITSFIIDNNIVYRELALNFNENIEIYDNEVFVELDKKTLVVYNPFQIELNEKKMIATMYKELQNNIHDEERIVLSNIENNFLQLVEKLSLEIDFPINYNESIDMNKLFQSFDVKFQTPEPENYLELVVSYLRLCSNLLKIKYIFSFGLLQLLSKDEIKLLQKELELMDLLLVDFSTSTSLNKNVYYVDKDWFIV